MFYTLDRSIVQVSVEGIQMGMPPDWNDPNAQALHDSPDEEALLGDPYASLTRK